jgi:hypothetical protein
MSKKNKTRKVAAQNPISMVSPAGIKAAGMNSIPRPYTSTFNPDYSNVIKDLKRIGTLAASFFVILIVLSFFLR